MAEVMISSIHDAKSIDFLAMPWICKTQRSLGQPAH